MDRGELSLSHTCTLIGKRGLFICDVRATVKAGTQERGTEVMWFHTGNIQK